MGYNNDNDKRKRKGGRGKIEESRPADWLVGRLAGIYPAKRRPRADGGVRGCSAAPSLITAVP